MNQLLSIWNALDPRRRTIVGVATSVVFVAVLLLSRMAAAPTLSLLYAGLAGNVAGEIVTALDQQNVAYEVRGTAIYVESGKRDQIRMTLAGSGLPASQSEGYELLDDMSGFGTTSQMFDAVYQRAKEGELARTILSLPQITGARVHIATPEKQLFSGVNAPTASITIATSAGGLSASQAKALRSLVAASVTGLSPQAVSVIDADRGLIPFEDALLAGGGDTTRATELKHNVENLLAAHVGQGNAVVEVSIVTNLDRETLVERRFDPESRVAISTDTEEVSGNSNGGQSGAVTVASNLPDGDAAGSNGSSTSTNSESRERINYEVSESTRELVQAPGAIKRLTVAVLIKGISTTDATGVVNWAPRPAADMEAIQDLVESAVGFDDARGDVVTVRAMEFQQAFVEGELTEPSVLAPLTENIMSLVKYALLSIVALVLSMFVVRPILLQPKPAALDLPPPAPVDVTPETALLSGSVQQAQQAALPDPIENLRQIISTRQEETAAVLRNWIETSEENA